MKAAGREAWPGRRPEAQCSRPSLFSEQRGAHAGRGGRSVGRGQQPCAHLCGDMGRCGHVWSWARCSHACPWPRAWVCVCSYQEQRRVCAHGVCARPLPAVGNQGAGLQCLGGFWCLCVCLPTFKTTKSITSRLGFPLSLENSGMGPLGASIPSGKPLLPPPLFLSWPQSCLPCLCPCLAPAAFCRCARAPVQSEPQGPGLRTGRARAARLQPSWCRGPCVAPAPGSPGETQTWLPLQVLPKPSSSFCLRVPQASRASKETQW